MLYFKEEEDHGSNLSCLSIPWFDKRVGIQPIAFPPQHQEQQPGMEWLMMPPPIFDYAGYTGAVS